jgi:hypothetical protein
MVTQTLTIIQTQTAVVRYIKFERFIYLFIYLFFFIEKRATTQKFEWFKLYKIRKKIKLIGVRQLNLCTTLFANFLLTLNLDWSVYLKNKRDCRLRQKPRWVPPTPRVLVVNALSCHLISHINICINYTSIQFNGTSVSHKIFWFVLLPGRPKVSSIRCRRVRPIVSIIIGRGNYLTY